MPEKTRRLPRVNKKVALAVGFIGLFVLSLAAVFRVPPPASTPEGYVNVNRSENYWINQTGNVTEARYLVNYGIVAVADTPKVTITDKAESNLTWIILDQEVPNIQVSYDAATGQITVVATSLVAGDKVFGQAAFKMDPVSIFTQGEMPVTQVTPSNVAWGDETDVAVNITPFRIQQTKDITEVGVYCWFTDAAAEMKNLSTNPTTACDPPLYQAIWQYKNPTTYNFTAHSAVYHIKMPVLSKGGDVLLRTWVEARYTSPLLMATDGTITGAKGYFFRVDSAISYQYEHPIVAKPIG